MAKALVRTNSGGKSSSRRRARPSSSVSPSHKRKNSESNYEFFPALTRLSSNKSSNMTVVGNSPKEETKTNPNEEDQLVDPGNPIGNTVNCCVDTFYDCGSQPVSVTFKTIVQSCNNANLGDVMVDLFLCDHLILTEGTKINSKELEASPGKSEGAEHDGDDNDDDNDIESEALSPDKKGKTAWKKTLKIIPGKKLLRSISMKRKKEIKTEDEEQKLLVKDQDQDQDGKDLTVAASYDSADTIFLFPYLESTQRSTVAPPSSPSQAIPQESTNASKSVRTKEEDNDALNEGGEKSNTEKSYTEKSEDSLDLFWSSALFNQTWNQDSCAEGSTGHDTRSEGMEPEDGCCTMETSTTDEDFHDGEDKETTAVEKSNKEAQDVIEEDEEDDDNVRVGLEMILDESSVKRKKWKMAPWKKVEGIHRTSISTSSESRAISSEPPSNVLKPEAKADAKAVHEAQVSNEPYWKENYVVSQEEKEEEHENRQDDTAQSVSTTKRDEANIPTNEIRLFSRAATQDQSDFTLEDARSKSIISQRGITILRIWRLRSALGIGKTQKSSPSSISKQRRSRSKRILVISGLPKRRKSSSKKNSTTVDDAPIQTTITVVTQTTPTPKSDDKEQFGTVADASTAKHAALLDSDDNTNPLEYSDSDDEQKQGDGEGNTDKASNTVNTRDYSSTAVMGFQQWAWGIGGYNKDSSDDKVDEELPTSEDDNEKMEGEETMSSYTPSTKDNVCCQPKERDSHDEWIMNEDQLDSFTEDERKEEENCIGDEEQRDAEGDVRDAPSVDSPKPKPDIPPEVREENTTKEETAKKQARQFRLKGEGVAQNTLSKNIRKSLSSIKNKTMRKTKSKDFPCDVSVSTELTSECGDASIEAIWMGSAIEDRNPSSTDKRKPRVHQQPLRKRKSRANSAAAFSKAKKFWKLKTLTQSQNQNQNQLRSARTSESNIVTHIVEHFPEHDFHSVADSITINDIDSIGTNTFIEGLPDSDHDHLELTVTQDISFLDDLRDMAIHGFLGTYDDDDSLASSYSSHSWVRDDDTLESTRDQYTTYNVSDGVIRE